MRSVREVTGYTIEASDGEIGPTEDLLVDLNGSRILSIVADASRNYEAILPVESVEKIVWDRRAISVRGLREEIGIPSTGR